MLCKPGQNSPPAKSAGSSADSRVVDHTTLSGVPLKQVYVPDDLSQMDTTGSLPVPGTYPYTRGIHDTMYRGRLWTMRQFAGFGTPQQTNERYKFLLHEGQTGLSVAFDLPTLYGRDSDDPLSEGEVGKCGVAIDTIDDMRILFDGIPLDQVSTSMTINAPSAWIFAFFLANAIERGISTHKLRGTLQNDILKEFIAQKEWIFPPRPHLRLITDIMGFCKDHVPQWNTISISGYHIREAGSTAAQELAFTLADGFCYVEEGIKAGMHVDEFAPRLSFFFNSHIDFFEEIAKMRAARRIWSRHLRERYGAKDPKSWLCRFHVQTAGCSLTAQQPMLNVVRTAFEALAAVLGGCQSLHTNSMDEALALPTESAVEVALRTQQVLAFETGVATVADPLGGSYFIESLTNELEAQAEAYFQRIEEFGGVVPAIEAGFFQREIMRAAYDYQKALESGRKHQLAVNLFNKPNDNAIPILYIDEAVASEQIAQIRRVKANRDNLAADGRLHRLQTAAEGSDNLMPYLIDCAHARCSLGEISEALAAVWGRYLEPALF